MRYLALMVTITLLVFGAAAYVVAMGTTVIVCDTRSVTLRDGTVISAPPEALAEASQAGSDGPCWRLPIGVTAQDIDHTPGTQPPTVDD